MDNPELRLAYQRSAKGVEFITPEDNAILSWYYGAIMRITENRFRQAQLGTVDPAIMRQVGGSSGVYRHPYFGFWWPSVRDQYAEDFGYWVEDNLTPNVQDTWNPFPDELRLPDALNATPRRSR